MMPGWTRPGVMTIGAAQTLVRRYGVAPGGRVLVAGHGPLGLQLAVEMRRLGVDVVALAERGRPRPALALARAARPPRAGARRAGLSPAPAARPGAGADGWEAVESSGARRAKGARLRRIRDGATRDIAADTICIGDGFAPQAELARLMGVPVALNPRHLRPEPRATDRRTQVPGLWIAGDAGGLGGAQLAEVRAAGGRGRAATSWPERRATAATARATRRDPLPTRALATLRRARRAPAPRRHHPLPLRRGHRRQVRTAIADGATDPGALKRATRIGMGRCQGRYCLPPPCACWRKPGTPRRPRRFLPRNSRRGRSRWARCRWKSPNGAAIAKAPRRAARPWPDPPLAQTTADLVIIGAGITGISAALYAARAGADVICLDRGAVNGEASGGNAGSLHLQLLSWDFGGKAVSGGSPQLRTLPLQQESIALWSQLETELGADFEMKVTGGMMVAENATQIAFLEAKAAAEARVGIATEVIDAARIRAIVPAISDSIVAAAWCPGEGKINPLAATPALARAARGRRRRIEEMTPVTGVAARARRLSHRHPARPIHAARVLIAAGGWSAQIARHARRSTADPGRAPADGRHRAGPAAAALPDRPCRPPPDDETDRRGHDPDRRRLDRRPPGERVSRWSCRKAWRATSGSPRIPCPPSPTCRSSAVGRR